MLHGFSARKDKKTFGMNSTQFHAFCSDCQINKATMCLGGGGGGGGGGGPRAGGGGGGGAER